MESAAGESHGRFRVGLAVSAAISIGVSLLFSIGGIAKLSDPTLTIFFMKIGLHLGFMPVRPLVTLLGVCELLLGAWLVLSAGRSMRALAAALLTACFFLGLLIAAARLNPGQSLSCGCFGALQPPLGGQSINSHIALDSGLILFLSLGLVLGSRALRSADRASGDPANGVGASSATAVDPAAVQT